jgi:hypothetical protein
VDAKSSKEMMPKVGDNNETSRPEAYEIHLYPQRGDRVGYGAASTKSGSEHKCVEVVHRSEGIAGWVALWRRRLMRKCGKGRGEDVAMMIESVRVEQVHEAHKVAVAGRHDEHEETWTSWEKRLSRGSFRCHRYPRAFAFHA